MNGSAPTPAGKLERGTTAAEICVFIPHEAGVTILVRAAAAPPSAAEPVAEHGTRRRTPAARRLATAAREHARRPRLRRERLRRRPALRLLPQRRRASTELPPPPADLGPYRRCRKCMAAAREDRMSRVIGYAVRDGDGIAIRLEAGPRRGCYRVAAEEVPDLLAGFPATLCADDAPVGDIAASRSLRVLRGAFRAGLGFLDGRDRLPGRDGRVPGPAGAPRRPLRPRRRAGPGPRRRCLMGADGDLYCGTCGRQIAPGLDDPLHCSDCGGEIGAGRGHGLAPGARPVPLPRVHGASRGGARMTACPVPALRRLGRRGGRHRRRPLALGPGRGHALGPAPGPRPGGGPVRPARGRGRAAERGRPAPRRGVVPVIDDDGFTDERPRAPGTYWACTPDGEWEALVDHRARPPRPRLRRGRPLDPADAALAIPPGSLLWRREA